MGKGLEKGMAYFLYTTDSNVFAQTLHPQVKKHRYLKLAHFGWGNEHFHGNRNMHKFWKK